MAAPMSSTEAVPAITADSIVGETMRAHLATTAVFFRRRMHCPGCPMSAFMTVRDAAASYDACVDDLVAELRPPAAPYRCPHALQWRSDEHTSELQQLRR